MDEEQEVYQAADGQNLPGRTKSAGDVINLLEDGNFSMDLYNQMVELGRKIEEVADLSGGKAKGKITLTLELTREDGAFKIASDYKVTEPKMPRARSIMWTDPNTGDFTRFPPNQRQLFGLKSAGGGGGIRNV